MCYSLHNTEVMLLTNIFLLKLSCNVPLYKSRFSSASISYQDELEARDSTVSSDWLILVGHPGRYHS